jgi:hypothetical protein
MYIGVDNGLTGALVALSDLPGVAPIASLVMPTQGNAKGNEVNVREVWAWLSQWKVDDITVILETPGKHSPGVNALCSMWDSYGALRSLFETRYIKHHRIAPQTWQAVMLPSCEKGQTKPFALSVACRLWPQEKWLASDRSKKPHEGLIDAALIGEYGRRKRL